MVVVNCSLSGANKPKTLFAVPSSALDHTSNETNGESGFELGTISPPVFSKL